MIFLKTWLYAPSNIPIKPAEGTNVINRKSQNMYSPVAALNRTFALSKAAGNGAAIPEAEKLQLNDNHYYYVLLGELYVDLAPGKALENFQKGYVMAKTTPDKEIILSKIQLLKT